jgi:hypothetical protein
MRFAISPCALRRPTSYLICPTLPPLAPEPTGAPVGEGDEPPNGVSEFRIEGLGPTVVVSRLGLRGGLSTPALRSLAVETHRPWLTAQSTLQSSLGPGSCGIRRLAQPASQIANFTLHSCTVAARAGDNSAAQIDSGRANAARRDHGEFCIETSFGAVTR